MYYVHNIRVASTAETQTDAETTTYVRGHPPPMARVCDLSRVYKTLQ